MMHCEVCVHSVSATSVVCVPSVCVTVSSVVVRFVVFWMGHCRRQVLTKVAVSLLIQLRLSPLRSCLTCDSMFRRSSSGVHLLA